MINVLVITLYSVTQHFRSVPISTTAIKRDNLTVVLASVPHTLLNLELRMR